MPFHLFDRCEGDVRRRATCVPSAARTLFPVLNDLASEGVRQEGGPKAHVCAFAMRSPRSIDILRGQIEHVVCPRMGKPYAPSLVPAGQCISLHRSES